MAHNSKAVDIARVAAFIRALSDLTNDYTMPSQQQLLLLALGVHGTVNQQDIEDYTGVKKSSNSRNILKLGDGEKPLEEPGPGYVKAEPDLRDRRLNLVSLTPKGRALLDEAWERAFGVKSFSPTHKEHA